jgi:hypothetical protein
MQIIVDTHGFVVKSAHRTKFHTHFYDYILEKIQNDL